MAAPSLDLAFGDCAGFATTASVVVALGAIVTVGTDGAFGTTTGYRLAKPSAPAGNWANKLAMANAKGTALLIFTTYS
jgi:hypothetical protein